MKTSKQARRDAKHLFRGCCVDGLLDEGRAREAVRRLLDEKPRGFLGVLSHFQRLVKLDIERRTATVESAVPLTSELREELKASLERVGGRGLSIAFAENPSLIGGLRVKVGCDVYDGSIRTRLARLAERF